MLGSLIGIVSDAVKVATAPVEIAVDLTRAVTQPIAGAVEDVVRSVKDELTDDHQPK